MRRKMHSALTLAIAAALVSSVAASVLAAPVQGDFDADGKTDLTVYRPADGTWYVLQSSTGSGSYAVQQWGLPGDVHVEGDFDGDGKADFAVYRRILPWRTPEPASEWFILLSSSNYATFSHQYFGLVGDIPVPADYDGDGKTDIAVYRPFDGVWHVLRSSVVGSGSYVTYANVTGSRYTTDYPVPADYDGDGKADPAVFRRVSSTWFFRLSTSGFASITSAVFGTGVDRPVPADYDGDGRADLALYRPTAGTWSLRPSSGGALVAVTWGLTGDVPVVGDYDGDGRADPAVYRPSDGVWYALTSSVGYAGATVIQWGLAGDRPGPGTLHRTAHARIGALTNELRASDFDGDGVSDLTVFRQGTWYAAKSSAGYGASTTFNWGLDGDVPVSGDYDGDGTTDLAVWRPGDGSWYFVLRPRAAFPDTHDPWQFGIPGDETTPADYDGDGSTDLALFRTAAATWYFHHSTSPSGFDTVACDSSDICAWGTVGDRAVAADYDGDGRTDKATYHPATGAWSIRQSTTRMEVTFQLGLSSDIPVPADYDGDGAADIAVFRPSTAEWLVRLSTTGYTTTQTYTFGQNGDVPVPGDYDGDGTIDIAVFHPSTGQWFILKSSTSFTQGVGYQWGLPGDIPILRRQ